MENGLLTLDGLQVLVVEDDDDTRDVLTLGLTLYGADVVAVNCAASAIEELEKKVPDVMLSDIGLTLYGADVVAVNCAASAIEELEKRVPDVMLSDIGLPDEDGLALIRRVRQLPPSRGGRVPAVAVTAFTLGDDTGEATRAGFQRHFRKPVDTGTLFGAVVALARTGRIERRFVTRRSRPTGEAHVTERRMEYERRSA